MNRITLFAILAPVSLCFAIAHAQTPESLGFSSKDERAARQVMADFQAIWNAHDMKALAELCTEDADFVVIRAANTCMVETKSTSITMRFTRRRSKIGQTRITFEDIRFIRPDVAIMHVRFEGKSRLPEDDKRGGTLARATVVVEKGQGKWLISAFHNTLVMDPACRVVGGVFNCPEDKR